MTKNFALLLAAFGTITALSVHGQVAVGFRVGAGWANMAFPDKDDDQYPDLNWETTAIAVPSFALMADLPLTGRLSLVPELAFVQRGYAYKGNNTPSASGVDNHLVLDNMDLNLLAKFHFGQEPVRPHLLFGATWGKMIGARFIQDEDLGSSYGEGSGQVLVPDDLDMRTLNLGLCGGAGFTFSVGSTWLMMEGRYQYGLTDIWNGMLVTDINVAPIGELHSFDRSWQFHIGWIIPVIGENEAEAGVEAPLIE